MTRPATGAERQRRYRDRNKERLAEERAARLERERVRGLPDDARCQCCGETRKVFLATAGCCWNCQHAASVGVCPHQGHGTLG